MHQVERFTNVGQFLSYCRLVRCAHESANKKVGSGNKKIGNAHLRWAFGEAVCLFLRTSERAKQFKQKLQRERGEGKAMGILAARLARGVYHMLRKQEAFDEERFWNGKAPTAISGNTAGSPRCLSRGSHRSVRAQLRHTARQVMDFATYDTPNGLPLHV